MTDHETERSRLKRIYSEMSDAGVGELALDARSLTEVAREVLRAEMETRGMQSELALLANASETKAGARKVSGPLVMVKRFRDLPEAFVAKSILDSAEIDSFLADENIVRIDWLYSNLVGGAKLMVRPEDYKEAVELLKRSANSEIQAADGQENSANTIGDESE